MYYILDENKTPVVATIEEFARLYADTNARIVKRTDMPDGVFVSTVFLGLDHGWGEGKPILFETMIFDGPYDENQWRYTTWDEAVVHHDQIVNQLATNQIVTDPE